MPTPPRILILVTGSPMPGVAARRGPYERWIRERTGDAWQGIWCARELRGGVPLPGPRDADAFVITGSASSVTERAAWMLRAEELVRAVVHARRPILGICFGHQMIAQALGGRVARNPRGREMGTVRLERLVDDWMFAGLPRAFDVHQTHVDVVARPPPGAEVLATTARDRVAAYRIGDRVRAVQFHPEFDADAMRGYVAERAEVLRGEGRDPVAMIAGIHDGGRAGSILRAFARRVAALGTRRS
jgi:GMP synthase (glutamine-hydrolysing)